MRMEDGDGMSGKHGMMRRTHELNRGIGEVVVPEGLTDVAIEEAGQKALRTELDNDVLENHGALPVELVRGLVWGPWGDTEGCTGGEWIRDAVASLRPSSARGSGSGRWSDGL